MQSVLIQAQQLFFHLTIIKSNMAIEAICIAGQKNPGALLISS